MPPGFLFLERPEILAPALFLLGFVVGFATRASISRRKQRRARSSYPSDATAASTWRLQPPATQAAVAQVNDERLQEVADAPGITEKASAAALTGSAGRIH